METKDFLLKYGQDAINDSVSSGVPPSITLAQAILESAKGESELAKKAFNFFGQKAPKGYAGAIIDMMTGEDFTPDNLTDAWTKIKAPFKKFSSFKESLKSHSNLLTSRYYKKFLGNIDFVDYKSYANGLRQAGYATDPQYPEKLISLIEKNKLQTLDVIAADRRKNELKKKL